MDNEIAKESDLELLKKELIEAGFNEQKAQVIIDSAHYYDFKNDRKILKKLLFRGLAILIPFTFIIIAAGLFWLKLTANETLRLTGIFFAVIAGYIFLTGIKSLKEHSNSIIVSQIFNSVLLVLLIASVILSLILVLFDISSEHKSSRFYGYIATVFTVPSIIFYLWRRLVRLSRIKKKLKNFASDSHFRNPAGL